MKSLPLAALVTVLVAAMAAGTAWAVTGSSPPERPKSGAVAAERSPAATAAKSADEMTPAERAEAERKRREELLRQARESARVRGALGMRERKPTEVEETSVADVLKLLGELGNFGVVFDPALEEQAIDLGARRVTLRLTGLTYEQVLRLILPREVGYKVMPGYILVTTLEKSWLPLKVETYPILLLLAEVPNFVGPRFEMGDFTQRAGGAAGGGFGDLFQTPAQAEEEPRVTPDQIIDLILRHVRHDQNRMIAPWQEEGGPASITHLGGRLVIAQTPEGHRAVRELLYKLGM